MKGGHKGRTQKCGAPTPLLFLFQSPDRTSWSRARLPSADIHPTSFFLPQTERVGLVHPHKRGHPPQRGRPPKCGHPFKHGHPPKFLCVFFFFSNSHSTRWSVARVRTPAPPRSASPPLPPHLSISSLPSFSSLSSWQCVEDFWAALMSVDWHALVTLLMNLEAQSEMGEMVKDANTGVQTTMLSKTASFQEQGTEFPGVRVPLEKMDPETALEYCIGGKKTIGSKWSLK